MVLTKYSAFWEGKIGTLEAIDIAHTYKVSSCTLEYRGTGKDWEMLGVGPPFCAVVRKEGGWICLPRGLTGLSRKSVACLSGTGKLLIDCCVYT